MSRPASSKSQSGEAAAEVPRPPSAPKTSEKKKGTDKKKGGKKKPIVEEPKILFEMFKRAVDGDAQGMKLLFESPDSEKKYDLVDGEAGEALVKAAAAGHENVVAVLLEFGGDINYKQGKALHVACIEKHLNMVKFLLKSGADIQSKSMWSEMNALHFAARAGKLDLVTFFVEQGLSVNEACHPDNVATNNGWAPLHFAVDQGYSDVVKFLVSKGADIHQTTRCGDTALGLAAEHGHFDLIRYLVAKGAKINVVRRELNVVQWAVYRAMPDIVQFLVALGADPNLKFSATWFPDQVTLRDLIKREFSPPVFSAVDLAIYRGIQEGRNRTAASRAIKEVRWYYAPPKKAEAAPSGPKTSIDDEPEPVADESVPLEERMFHEDVVSCIVTHMF